MSVLGLKSGYTVKYGLSPQNFPREILRAQAIFSVYPNLSPTTDTVIFSHSIPVDRDVWPG